MKKKKFTKPVTTCELFYDYQNKQVIVVPSVFKLFLKEIESQVIERVVKVCPWTSKQLWKHSPAARALAAFLVSLRPFTWVVMFNAGLVLWFLNISLCFLMHLCTNIGPIFLCFLSFLFNLFCFFAFFCLNFTTGIKFVIFCDYLACDSRRLFPSCKNKIETAKTSSIAD